MGGTEADPGTEAARASTPSASTPSASTPSASRPTVQARPDGLAFDCPRCGTPVVQRLYGPCQPCRRQLVDIYAGDHREIEVARFEPAMHVTPNAVATKE